MGGVTESCVNEQLESLKNVSLNNFKKIRYRMIFSTFIVILGMIMQ